MQIHTRLSSAPNFLVGHFHSLDMEKEKQQATYAEQSSSVNRGIRSR